jgi:hypothetical protein
MSRRRAKTARFTPLPTQSDDEPYRYLSLPPATRPAKNYHHGPYYPGAASSPPPSPNARMSRYSAASPARSLRAQSIRFEQYGHGPFYPGDTGPRVGPGAQVSLPRATTQLSPIAPSFSTSQSTMYASSPATVALTCYLPLRSSHHAMQLSPLSPRHDEPRGSGSRTVSAQNYLSCNAATYYTIYVSALPCNQYHLRHLM